MTLFLPLHNQFASPAGVLPGINYNHPASNRLIPKFGLSAIPVLGGSGNFVDLLTGTPGTLVSTGILSQVKRFGVASTNTTSGAVVLFNSGPTTFTKLTLAVICSFSSVGGSFQGIMSVGTDLDAAQFILENSVGHFDLFNSGSGGNDFGFLPIVGHTYFVVMSSNNSTINFVVRDLNSGFLFQNSISQGAIFQTTTSGYQLMNNAPTAPYTQPTLGSVYAAMANTNVYLSMQQMVAWSLNPWSFWYPDAVAALGVDDLIKGIPTILNIVAMNARETGVDIASFGISLYGTGTLPYVLIAGANVSIKAIPAIRGGAASIED